MTDDVNMSFVVVVKALVAIDSHPWLSSNIGVGPIKFSPRLVRSRRKATSCADADSAIYCASVVDHANVHCNLLLPPAMTNPHIIGTYCVRDLDRSIPIAEGEVLSHEDFRG
jgi:hypothetical protein